jgi:hypothetical protein
MVIRFPTTHAQERPPMQLMPRPMRRRAVMLVLLVAGCRHAPPPVAAPVSIRDDHCWHAVFRTPLPPDTVALRFERAFTGLGLTNASSTMRGDTVWSHAGPTRLAGDWGDARYEARVVAFRVADSTHFRHFVGVAPASSDTLNTGARLLAFCGALGRASQVHGTAPREPDGEEALELWKRRPESDGADSIVERKQAQMGRPGSAGVDAGPQSTR